MGLRRGRSAGGKTLTPLRRGGPLIGMQKLKATEVFTPGVYPTHTYVSRSDDDVEKKLRFALETKGQVTSLSGPSKSGKTVLVERVVGSDNLITITGAGIEVPEQIWVRTLGWMESPSETTTTTGRSASASLEGTAKAEVGALVAKAEVGGSASIDLGAETSTTRKLAPHPLAQVVKEIGNSDFVLLIDDFHYMSRTAQVEAAKQIKEAARLGVKIITAAVPHRSDDVVRANPELRGRVVAVDLAYWRREELEKIGQLGFFKLNAAVGGDAIRQFAIESAGSPQLMQTICLYACFHMNLLETIPTKSDFALTEADVQKVFALAAAATDFRSLVDVLDSGPKTRGTERKIYQFSDGTEGDVYRCVLKAIAAEPLRQSFDYAEITERAKRICNGDPPVGSSVIGAMTHMSKLAEESFPRERVIDYDEQKIVLDMPDPYLLFYMRWSDRLVQSD